MYTASVVARPPSAASSDPFCWNDSKATWLHGVGRAGYPAGEYERVPARSPGDDEGGHRPEQADVLGWLLDYAAFVIVEQPLPEHADVL
jgi:hypothetical protein